MNKHEISATAEQLRAVLKLEREWRQRAERELAAAHEEIGALKAQIKPKRRAAMETSHG